MPRSLLLNIPEPCHENWQNMTPQEQGRFCGSCQKVVVDFSVMTDKELLDYFSKASQHVCGRFANDQLNKELIIPPVRRRITWAYVWNVLLASLLVTKSYAQGKPLAKKVNVAISVESRTMGLTVTPMDPAEAIIPVTMKGVVLDAQNNHPVIGASINISGTQMGTMTDTLGGFLLRTERKDALELEFSAIGYETQKLAIDKTTNWKSLRILLKPAFAPLQEVTVVASGTVMGKMVSMGGATSCVKLTALEKIQRNINDWTPGILKKDVKIYPNPVMRGNTIQVKLNLPQTGEYRLELLSSAGQVMLVQPLFMQTMEQLVEIYTQTKWSAGIYWVRISSPKLKNAFEAKVLLQ